ncbi:hypothetical protein J1N35_023214 [Gossypium stocksii]|uniref:Potassium transporter n=1 Tax=Gossypium stocksii TaxID=47602 RepID=A0A9D4A2Y9_9ROSI|nr:hypothetical protein J1N35_023214 [Gossypium stocksii]
MSNATAEEDDIRVDIPMSDDQLKRNIRPILQKPYGSMDLVSVKAPANHGSHSKDSNWWVVLNLAFQSIGIVYGDLGTSPLYVYPSIFSNGIKHRDDILGALSLVFYTLTFLPLVKYVLVVLRANDNGEGGTFALYSLICRYTRVSLIPSQQAEDHEVSNYKLELPSKRLKLASVLKSSLEKSQFAKILLLLVTMLGTSMVIGDSIFTPSISVLSAVAGVKEVTSALTDGAEALFADLGHFSVRAIQVSMCSMVYPAFMLAYTGQSSYLRQYPDEVSDAFYKSVPGPLYWPMFVVSILAAAIASQAMISGTFSIVHQSLSLGCFPPVKVVYTSANHEGQVYIPAINYILMLACVGVTVGFKSTVKIGNAYGTAVVFVMTLTSSLLVLVMIMIWKTNIFLIILYILTIGFVELLYLSSVLYKFTSGGYLPLAFSAVLMIIMYVWNDVYRRKYHYELDHKISPARLKEISANKNMSRILGLAMFYSELVHGIPPIFEHYVSNVPALHSIIVFVSMKSLHINKVPPEERYFFRRVEPRELFAFRCVVRYGYKDVREVAFEETLVTRLKEFIQEEILLQNQMLSTIGNNAEKGTELEGEIVERNNDVVNAKQVEEEIMQHEIEQVQKEWEEAGIVHMIGESEVIAKKEANIMKRIVIDHAYNLLKRNVRQREKVFDIPHKRMLKVGMTCHL